MIRSGMTPPVAKFCSEYWRDNTVRSHNYKLHFWFRFCKKNNTDPFHFSAKKIGDYLMHLFNDGKSFNTIRAHRLVVCALMSLTHQPLNAAEKKQLDIIVNTVFAKRPPPIRPVYPIWDLRIVLDYFEHGKPNKTMYLKDLGAKLACLLRIATMRRNCELCHLDIRSMTWSEDEMKVEFVLNKPNKTMNARTPAEIARKLQTLVLEQLPIHDSNSSEKNICPVRCLKTYLTRTRFLRSKTTGAVFIINNDPFTAACLITIALWIKGVMKDAGVDITLYASHSIRSASSSLAYNRGINVWRILSTAGWTSTTSDSHFDLQQSFFSTHIDKT